MWAPPARVKRLDGVQAVQTLSRLNPTAPGKEDTFVLDFRNEAEDIFRAFKPYYEQTYAADAASPQKLYEMKAKLDGAHVHYEGEVEVEEFASVFFAVGEENAKAHAKLNQLLDAAVERFKGLSQEQQGEFKGWLLSFRNLYGFLSQIVPYQDAGLEKLYVYGRFLLTKLPRRDDGALLHLGEDGST